MSNSVLGRAGYSIPSTWIGVGFPVGEDSVDVFLY